MTDSLSYRTSRCSILKEFSRCDWHKQSSWRFLSSLEQSIAALYLLALIRHYFESCSGDESYSRGQWDTALRATPQSPKGDVRAVSAFEHPARSSAHGFRSHHPRLLLALRKFCRIRVSSQLIYLELSPIRLVVRYISAMDAPASGDIFPAVEAIRMIDEVDLTPPIEVPPVSPDAYPENVPEEEHRWLDSEIRRLKKERNAYILAHNYAPSDIQDVADAVGDSLYLAQKGAKSDADILLEASVLFMNQILAIMKKPHQRVLAPDLGALCSLAAHADPEKIRQWKRGHQRWNRHQLRQYLFGCEGGERLLLRIGECRKGHTACVGQLRPRSTDSFSSRCLSGVLRRQASWSSKINPWSDYG